MIRRAGDRRDVFGKLRQGDKPDVRNAEAHVRDSGSRHIDGRKAVRRNHARKQRIRRSGKDCGAPRREQRLEAGGFPHGFVHRLIA
jgi:hypothetical protein